MSSFGIFLEFSSNNNITGNTANSNSRDGIQVYQSSNNILLNNTANSNDEHGIRVYLHSENNIIQDNTASNNGRGIHLDQSSSNTLVNNTASSNNAYGLSIDGGSDNILRRNILIDNDHGIGLASTTNNLMENCTITGSITLDIQMETDSTLTSLNSTFNKMKVEVLGGSVLTVRWYLHVGVFDMAGDPVVGATVRVRDNANGTYDENFTTGPDGWVRWIVVTEYVQSSMTYYTPHTVSVESGSRVFENNPREVIMNDSRDEPFNEIPFTSEWLLPLLLVALLVAPVRRRRSRKGGTRR